MLALGVVASDLSLLLYRVSVELALSPFSALLALTPAGAPRAGTGSGGLNPCSQTGAPQLARSAFYADLLRRAAPVAQLFAAAPPGGEREAAYHALARLAAAANADLGTSLRGAFITPGALYRDLTQGARRLPGADARDAAAPAFDEQVCAELDRRDTAAGS